MKYFPYVGILLWMIGCGRPAQDVAMELILDPSITYQRMEGFGASDAWRCQFVGKYWPDEKKEYIADLLFSRKFDDQGDPRGIGLSIWRFYLGSGTTEMGEASEIVNEWRRAECFQLPDGSYDWTRQEGQQWFLKAARDRGVEKFLAFSITPPVHMSRNGKGYSSKGDIRMNIAPGKMDDYARFMTDVMLHFRDRGEPFDYLSPFNEPQWDWDQHTQEGTAAQNQDLFELTRALSADFERRGLFAEILLGEAATVNHLAGIVKDDSRDDQIQVFFGKDSPLNVAGLPGVRRAITAHSYFITWPLDTLLASRKRLAERLQQTDPSLEYWQTEFCILENNPEIGQGSGRDLAMPTALYVARVIHADLVMNNASSWQWWTALSQCDYKDGLVYLDTGHGSGMTDPRSAMNDSLKYDGVVRESKLLWVLGNYSRFIPPGARRVEARFKEPQDPVEQLTRVMVSAYHDPFLKRYVLVAINQAAERQTLSLLDHEGKKIASGVRLATYTTSADQDLGADLTKAPELSLDPHSVTTLLIPESYLKKTNLQETP